MLKLFENRNNVSDVKCSTLCFETDSPLPGDELRLLRCSSGRFQNDSQVVYSLLFTTCLLFLTGRGKVEFLVGPKIRHKLFTLCKSCIKPG